VELLRLADADGAVPGLDQIAAAVWRERLHAVSSADTLATQMATFERQGLRVLIPGEKDWPAALNDLGARTPYALWTRGETALLAKPLSDRFTLTGARASTAYGDHMAIELASDLALSGRVVVAGGAYGIEAAAHRSALATGGKRLQSSRVGSIARTLLDTRICLRVLSNKVSSFLRVHRVLHQHGSAFSIVAGLWPRFPRRR
jgi:DNA processing protein